MRLYLIRHGEAESEEVHPARPLSKKGRADVEKTAGFALAAGLGGAEDVFHSGKLRARETAEIVARLIQPTVGIIEKDGLSPNDEPSIWAGRLKGAYKNTVLVGHLPHLGRLASLLVCGRNLEAVSFEAGGIACLERDRNGSWTLLWSVMPEMAGG